MGISGYTYFVENPLGRDVSHIKLTAIAAIVILIGGGAWQAVQLSQAKDMAGTFVAVSSDQGNPQNTSVPAIDLSASATDPIGAVSQNAVGEVIGAYAGLQQEGIYSSTTGAQIAGSIGMGLQAPVSYTPITASRVQTTRDTSYQAMIKYRSDLQTSLKPLLNNKTPEYEIWGMYIETGKQTYLDQLTTAAANYTAAASSTEALTVPADAIQVQIGLVNSMNEFATTLNDMVSHANDPIASTVLLENYNQAENDVLTAFQALVTYEQSKTQ